jgi:hypothetical protein
MVDFALTKRSKLDSTRTLTAADFFSIDCDRKERPWNRSSVRAVLWTSERKSEGEKVVDESRNLLPVFYISSMLQHMAVLKAYVVSHRLLQAGLSTLVPVTRFVVRPADLARPFVHSSPSHLYFSLRLAH